MVRKSKKSLTDYRNGLDLKKEKKMSDETERGKHFVRVKDAAGNDWLCPLDALMNPEDASEEELNSCVDDATVGRYAGDIKVED
jgi:hypothetical protein